MKELFIAEYDRIYERLIAAGCPDREAHEIASERAYPAMRDTLADLADSLRKQMREQS